MYDISSFGTFFKDFASVVTAGGVVALVGLFFKRDEALRKLSGSAIADVMDHYDKELIRIMEREGILIARNEALTKRLEEVEDRQRQCEERERISRKRLIKAEQEIAGLLRSMAANSTDKLVILESEVPLSVEAAKRIKKMHEDDNNGK